MPEIVELEKPKDAELKKKIETISWDKYIDFGSVKIQVRNGKPVLITIEKTVRLD